MTRSFKMPDLGEGIHEAEVLAVPVTVGQVVKEGDIILEVETDKAAVQIPSPFSGKIKQILVNTGDIVNVGDDLIIFTDDKKAGVSGDEQRTEESEASAKIEATAEQPSLKHKKGPVPASPATRRLAREMGVDLNRVPATGPAGLVTAEDVRAFTEKSKETKEAPEALPEVPAKTWPAAISETPLPDFSKWGPVERVPFRSIRKATARQMTLAWSQIPHVNSQDVVDVSKLEDFRQKHKSEIEAVGGKLTMTVFALKAVATALKTYPNFNTTLDLAGSEMIIKHYYHIGVAVSTDSGLVVPVIRDVDRKSIKELAVELNDLVQRARSRKTKREEMQGGTFTITNAGALGGGFFAPIINYPEVAIMGMGKAHMQPAAVAQGEGKFQIIPRLMMPIVLCIDHRVLDGADAIRFLQLVAEALEDPDELLMTMI